VEGSEEHFDENVAEEEQYMWILQTARMGPVRKCENALG
jgi:hypothetical protein